MRLPFFDPTREEVVAVATDLITRFGLEAQDEALHLTEVAANMRAVRNCQLYRLAAREIERSFAEARTRMSAAPGSEAAGQSFVGAQASRRKRRDARNNRIARSTVH